MTSAEIEFSLVTLKCVCGFADGSKNKQRRINLVDPRPRIVDDSSIASGEKEASLFWVLVDDDSA